MSELIQNVTTTFAQLFGYDATHLVQAPGRVNLIGEHTDYNDGFVLPCAINYALVHPKQVEAVQQAVAEHYEAATGLKASIYVCHATSGAGLVELA